MAGFRGSGEGLAGFRGSGVRGRQGKGGFGGGSAEAQDKHIVQSKLNNTRYTRESRVLGSSNRMPFTYSLLVVCDWRHSHARAAQID